ncbi:hypothetical protein GCM10019016_090890 [Streptomyces prasinosporus]|uniref:Uncharacterized protein n=1 Tax=Streptomyces prasinosporus TaxID=68256 RepID=A0ABP6U2T1_9ACTN
MSRPPQYSMIICEEVGLHQASPPLSYSGVLALVDLLRVARDEQFPWASPGADAGTVNRSGTSDPITPSRHTVGVRRVPGRRYRVRRSRTEARRSPEAASSTANVSVQTLLLPSPWSSTEVRRMSASPAAQRPITYQGVSVPSEYAPFSSIWIQVPSGVCAFQEAIASVEGTARRWTGEVQVAYSQAAVRPVCGSV